MLSEFSDYSDEFLEAADFPECLRDESRMTGRAETVSFPRSEAELRAHLAAAHEQGKKVTVQGARTGITGGAVPMGGHVIGLTRMNRILGLRRAPHGCGYGLIVEPGLTLAELQNALQRAEFNTTEWPAESQEAAAEFKKHGPHFFPVDPTETSASLGGMVACNSSGARSFFYGAMRSHVERLRVVLADGGILDLRRGVQRACGRQLRVETEDGRTLAGQLPTYTMPKVKNAAGYFVEDNMDLVDLFIGSEGTLGIISQIDLRVLPRRPWEGGVLLFFSSEEAAVSFVRTVRQAEPRPVAIEFFDRGALELLRAQKRNGGAGQGMPALPNFFLEAAVSVEYVAETHAELEAAMALVSELLITGGGDPDAAWVMEGAREVERLKALRHSVPEAVNLLIDERRRHTAGLTKLGTDLAVPDERLEDALAMYRSGLNREKLEAVIFGHIGDNHLHVNIIPKTLEEYQRGRELYLQWARAVVEWGGSVSAEHGIGKLKTALLQVMYGKEGVRRVRELKQTFDPEAMLNPGNLFE